MTEKQQQQQQQQQGTTSCDDTTTSTGQGTLLRQTLLTHHEVFVYKIPPLKNSGGHRYVT